jgi:hypothetical protein
MQDFSANWKFVKVLLALKDEKTVAAEENMITTITSTSKFACLVMCALRALISFFLLFEGFLWLSATTSFGDLILNAVALAFILDVDGILYAFGLPLKVRESLAEVMIADFSAEVAIRAQMEKGDTAAAMDLIQQYVSGTASLWNRAKWIFASFNVVYLYVFEGVLDVIPYLTVLPGYNHDVEDVCKGTFVSYDSMTCNEACSFWSETPCTQKCFPYGS